MIVPVELSWAQVVGRRLLRHHLLEPAPADRLVGVASDICGAHAQVGASVELMLGVRVQHITRRHVREALWEKRTLVKTVGLRGTLHVFPAGEVPLWMAANRLRFPAEEKRMAQSRIDPDELNAVIEAIADIVGPEPIDRLELEARLEERVGGWAVATNQGFAGSYKNWPLALGWAAALGTVCYGPGQGGHSTFVRLADWSGWRDEEPMDAGMFALRRFLYAYGPSTTQEFARWFALEPTIVRQLFEAIRDELAEVEVEGGRRWCLRSDLEMAGEPAPSSVRLVPHYDVFVVGSHPREQLMDLNSDLARASPGTAANFAVLLVGGRVAGVWDRKPKGKRLHIRVDAHRPLTARQRDAVAEQAERIAQIVELQCELEFTNLPLRRHL
jgi:hypothetical protein